MKSSDIHISNKEKATVKAIIKLINEWFVLNGREFPWRKPGSTVYEKIVTEILVQRTKAETVASIYKSFFKRFHDWKSLDTAPIEEIQKHLKPLGIWRRRSITLKILSHEMVKRNGVFPFCRKEIDNLTGAASM